MAVSIVGCITNPVEPSNVPSEENDPLPTTSPFYEVSPEQGTSEEVDEEPQISMIEVTSSTIMGGLLGMEDAPDPMGLHIDTDDLSGFHFYLYEYMPTLSVIQIVIKTEGWKDIHISARSAEELGMEQIIQPPETLSALDTPLDEEQIGDLIEFCEAGGLVSLIAE